MGADSAAVYFDIDSCAWRDLADAFGLFQTYAAVAWRGLNRADGLGGQAYADIGRGNCALSDNSANTGLFRVAVH